MSQVQTLPATNPIAFVRPRSVSNIHISSSPSLRLTAASDETGEDIFDALPPLHYGHREVHLRNGIMQSHRLVASGEADAERAFFVADLGQVALQHERWITALPEVHPFYAVKCNPDPYVLRLLAALGTGFDCASNNEIAQVLKIGGIDPDRIIFANPCKATSFVRAAGRAGVHTMTFDNADELHKVARTHPAARLVLRILTDDSKALCRLGLKFGAPLAAAPGLLATARSLGLNVVGVSFHVGSGCYDPDVYADAIARAAAAFAMGREVGYEFDLLDIGGGFEDATFEAAARVLRDAINMHFPDRHERGIRIIAEPGRFFVSTAFSIATNIIARRATDEENANAGESEDEVKAMYYINDGVYGAFNCIMFDHQVVQPYVLSMGGSFHVPAGAATQMCSVWGPTCDSIDLVSKRATLPRALQVGDWLGFDNMGAYTVCAASQFNGFDVSRVIYTAGGMGGAEARAALKRLAAEGWGHK
ncbi:pyridoxal-dependent decarboxylase [Schizophyllum fasciatum]